MPNLDVNLPDNRVHAPIDTSDKKHHTQITRGIPNKIMVLHSEFINLPFLSNTNIKMKQPRKANAYNANSTAAIIM